MDICRFHFLDMFTICSEFIYVIIYVTLITTVKDFGD